MPKLRAALEAEPGMLRILGRAAPAAHLRPALRKLFEQRFRVLQIGRIKSLAEPAVDLGQHSACFVLLALLLQKTTQTPHRAELPRLRLLSARDLDGATKGTFRLAPILGA